MTVQQYLFKLFISYNRLCIQTKIRIKNARKKYSAFDSVCMFFEQVWILFALLFVYLTRTKIEPGSPAWICFCNYLPAGNGMPALTTDTYLSFDQTELEYVPKTMTEFRETTSQSESEYNRMMETKLKTSKAMASDIRDNLIIAKICPFATVIRHSTQMDPTYVSKTTHLSSVRFLEIEYSCGNLPPITIEIPSSHYVVDNELLSKTYVLRYLEHLPMYSNWIFNEHNYEVKIIDYDSNMVSLTAGQYIVLEKDEYRVVNVSGGQLLNQTRLLVQTPETFEEGSEEVKDSDVSSKKTE